MRTFCWWIKGGRLLVLSAVISICGAKAFAQTAVSNTISVVTVQATTPVAFGPDSPGVFTIFRAGSTDATLNVWYDLDGTASNGVDYVMIPPHLVTIAAGATSSTIAITPLSNSPSITAFKTVVLTLTNSPLLTPVNYEIGSPSQAVVFIENSGITNPPPLSIVRPTEGAVFYTPTNILLAAAISYLNYFAPTNVEFFAGTNDLGKGILGVSSGVGGYVFLTWTNPPPGDYVLTAVGTSYAGLATTSAPVNVSVLPGPAPTNLPPVVNIFAPPNGAAFYTPTNIQILARASDPDGSVTSVEFFAGTNDLGEGLPVVLDPPGVNGIVGLVYLFNWLNPPPGNYPLTAVATDNSGASTVSAAVKIAVLPGPATNLPPVVRIISPANGAVFFAPINIPLYAYASASDLAATSLFDEVSNLEFYADGMDLGPGAHVVQGPPPTPGGPMPQYLILLPDRFFLIWSNAPVGPHQLTAVAEDYFGNSATSAPVNIKVVSSPPPPTNRPSIVNIVATDPIAIEGTNCWVWPGETNAPPTWAAWPTAVCRFFTNCGPKTATFTVRRFGDTNSDLTVAYHIGGTASNGVDYAALPGSVTIPAGERRALIPIVPIDDGPPDINKTVILALTPSTDTPPDYVIGWPPRAAAIIIDSDGPRPVTSLLPGGCFHLAVPAPDAAWFYIEYSTNMIDWTPVCTNQVINGSIDFVDPDAPDNPSRFYRAQPLPGAPAN